MVEFDPSILTLSDEAIAERYVGGPERLRNPDLVIMPDGNPYLYRWHLTERDYGGQYFHIQVASDPERPLHDHPWDNFSVILSGGYDEEFDEQPWITPEYDVRSLRVLTKGDTVFRPATEAHRLILPAEFKYTMTLFSFGPKINEWGFWYPEGKRSYKDVTVTTGNVSVHREVARAE